jgi:hypothetical protein
MLTDPDHLAYIKLQIQCKIYIKNYTAPDPELDALT